MIIRWFLKCLLLANSTAAQVEHRIQDRRLKDLAVTISSVLERSRAESTLTKYTTYFRKWITWSDAFEEINEFPADEKYVALYLASLVQENLSYAVIESSFYAIKHFHVIAGLKDPTDCNLNTYILEAAKRMRKRQTKKKDPISYENLLTTLVRQNVIS